MKQELEDREGITTLTQILPHAKQLVSHHDPHVTIPAKARKTQICRMIETNRETARATR